MAIHTAWWAAYGEALMLFIDSNGQQVTEQEAAVVSGIGSALQRAALTRYLVVNLGWVALNITEARVEIVARPKILASATIRSTGSAAS